MMKRMFTSARLYLLAASVAAASSLMLVAPARSADEVPAVKTTTASIDFAEQISRMVQNRRLDDLAKLTIPKSDVASAQLNSWTAEYIAAVQRQEAQREKQYTEAVDKALEYSKKGKFDEAMDKVVAAYQIARDQENFLRQDWVKDITTRVQAKAADYETAGQWLDSLTLFNDLNMLYEVDTRYKADVQRLTRRVRLLSVYTPKTLFEIRKEAFRRLEKERLEPATQPSSQPSTQSSTPTSTQPTTGPATMAAEIEEPASFPKWEDTTDGITFDMMKEALDRARAEWVEETTYGTMIRGGVESLRLFLSTPELGTEFRGLKDEGARKEFDAALDAAIKKVAEVKNRATDISKADAADIIRELLAINKTTVKLPEPVVILEFADGAIEKLDPFTAVIWPKEVPEFNKTTRGKFGGIGIQISLENNQLKVISPLEDSPAFKAGIEAGDVVTQINGKPTTGITISQAVDQITGEPGTEVVLRVKRSGIVEEKDYTLTRAIIEVVSVKGFQRDPADTSKWDFMLDPENKIGYIRITGFQEDTSKELRSAMASLQAKGMRGVILDLRFNPGGLLDQAVEISDMFLDHGNIVSTKGRTNVTRNIWKADKATQIPNSMPVVVLVNQYSASASEIFSGAMKDLHRGLIIGQRSFGKGSVQNLLPITNDRLANGYPKAMMKLTMSYYYLPDGESLHRRDGAKTWGVDPDVAVEMTPRQLGDMLRARRDSDVIVKNGATQPSTTSKPEPIIDTQLDTGLLLLRLQLLQTPL